MVYIGGRAKEVSLVEQDVLADGELNEVAASVLAFHLKRVLRDWRSMVGTRFETTVTIELKLDDSMPKERVEYEVEYGENGVIKRIKLTSSAKREILG